MGTEESPPGGHNGVGLSPWGPPPGRADLSQLSQRPGPAVFLPLPLPGQSDNLPSPQPEEGPRSDRSEWALTGLSGRPEAGLLWSDVSSGL